MASILDTIKEMLGVNVEETAFDTLIIIEINTVFMTLNQLGIGPSSVIRISNRSDEWEQFLGSSEDLEAVKSYVFFKVRLAFDPPERQTIIDAIKNNISELEFRLMIQVGETAMPAT